MLAKCTDGDFIIGGILHEHGERIPCTLSCENGLAELEEGLPEGGTPEAFFIVDLVNSHTHCADCGLNVPGGMSIEELIAPPNGLKHRYLSSLDREGLMSNIKRFSDMSADFGSSGFIDFREGGAEGCRALREASPDAVILGRPISEEYDPSEISDILSIADGIGLSSISDMKSSYIDSIADDVRSAKKIFAIHASERKREDIDAILSLDPAFVVHMCEGTDSDFSKCSEAEVPIAICPSSNMYFGKVPPIKRMIDSCTEITLGTDNGMLCEPDMISEAKLFCKILSQQGGDVDCVWAALSGFSSKILYRAKGISYSSRGRFVTVSPFGDRDGGDDFLVGKKAFRIGMK